MRWAGGRRVRGAVGGEAASKGCGGCEGGVQGVRRAGSGAAFEGGSPATSLVTKETGSVCAGDSDLKAGCAFWFDCGTHMQSSEAGNHFLFVAC